MPPALEWRTSGRARIRSSRTRMDAIEVGDERSGSNGWSRREEMSVCTRMYRSAVPLGWALARSEWEALRCAGNSTVRAGEDNCARHTWSGRETSHRARTLGRVEVETSRLWARVSSQVEVCIPTGIPVCGCRVSNFSLRKFGHTQGSASAAGKIQPRGGTLPTFGAQHQ
jgi:hypothetical protein